MRVAINISLLTELLCSSVLPGVKCPNSRNREAVPGVWTFSRHRDGARREDFPNPKRRRREMFIENYDTRPSAPAGRHLLTPCPGKGTVHRTKHEIVPTIACILREKSFWREVFLGLGCNELPW